MKYVVSGFAAAVYALPAAAHEGAHLHPHDTEFALATGLTVFAIAALLCMARKRGRLPVKRD